MPTMGRSRKGSVAACWQLNSRSYLNKLQGTHLRLCHSPSGLGHPSVCPFSLSGAVPPNPPCWGRCPLDPHHCCVKSQFSSCAKSQFSICAKSQFLICVKSQFQSCVQSVFSISFKTLFKLFLNFLFHSFGQNSVPSPPVFTSKNPVCLCCASLCKIISFFLLIFIFISKFKTPLNPSC